MAGEPKLTIDVSFNGGNGTATVRAMLNGKTIYRADRLDLHDEAAVGACVAAVCDGRPGIEPEAVRNELRAAADSVPRYQPFPTAALPAVVRDFIDLGAKALGCDESYIALPLLAGLAAAVGNSRRIVLKTSWCEPCIVWAVVVGESGTLKSPAFDLAMRPLQKLQTAAFAEYAEAMDRFAQAKAMQEADLAEWKKKGRKSGEPPPAEPEEPVAVRYVVADTTVEALAVLLEQQPRGLLMARDELSGWVNSFDAYKSCRGADVAHWLSMHRAGPLTVDRKTGRRVIHVPRAAVCIAGNVQPKALAAALLGRYQAIGADEAMDKPNKEHFDNGLAARLLFAMPPARPKRWTENDIPPAVEAAVRRLFDRLLAMEPGIDEEGEPAPIDLSLTPKAKRAWVQFFNEHAREQVELAGDLAAAWSKLEGYAARFALLHHLVRSVSVEAAPGAVDEESIAAGVALSRWFGDEAARVYAVIGGDSEPPEARERRELVRILNAHGGEITARGLMQASRKYRGRAEEAEAALGQLVAAGLADAWLDDHGGGRGRPVFVFTLTDSGNGNRNGEAPTETAIVLPLPPDMEGKPQSAPVPHEVAEWTA